MLSKRLEISQWAAIVLGSIVLGSTAANAQTEAGRGSAPQAARAAGQAPAEKSPSEKSPNLSRTEELIQQQINEFRKEHGRHALRFDSRLAQTAGDFARYMAKTDEYGHTADGREPWERAAAHGYQYCIVAENIAYEFSTEDFGTGDLARLVVQGWEHSPPHRRNILDRDVVETGVGLAHSRESGRYYAVQLFGRPKSARVQFEIVNQSPRDVHYALGKKAFDLPPRAIMSHTTCRPPTVTFQSPPSTESPSAAALPTLHPQAGDRFIIRENPQGALNIRNESVSGARTREWH
jgi:uncharacterized protein YkwD